MLFLRIFLGFLGFSARIGEIPARLFQFSAGTPIFGGQAKVVYTQEGMVHIGGILRLGEKVAEAAIICGGRWLQSVGYGLVDRIAKGVRRPSEFLLQEMNIKVNAGAGLPLLGMAVMLAGASLLSAPAFGQKLKIKKDATMTLTIPAGTHSSYYRKIKGGGYLLKKGEGILHFVNVKNSLKGTMILEEGALRIEENKELGHNSQKTGLHFTGGTLILASFGTNFILIENREIKIKRKNLGTFFTERSSHFLDLAFTVYVKSKLSGAGELKKTGVDDLNFKEIKAKGFTGTIRMEGGGLVIDGDNDLGGEKGSGLVFSGGTVRFAAPSPIVTVSIVELKSSRLITIEDRGTFDTMGNTVTVVVNSTLAGSGELKKTGSGLLDFRNVQASLFMGTIRLDAGGLLIEKDEDLGARSNSLIFSGGTVRFAAPSPTIAMSIVLGKSRLFTIGIGNTGTFDTMGNTAAVYRSKLVGAGELKKTGQGTLRLYSMQATAFEGTLRIEQGGLQIRNDADLGNKKAKVVLAGGNLILNSSVQTLLADREIFVKGFAGIVGNHTIIDSAIYADDDITLQVSGGVFLRGKQNQIKNLLVDGHVTMNADSLGEDGEGKKVGLAHNAQITFNQEEDDEIKDWHIRDASHYPNNFGTDKRNKYRFIIHKRGVGKLTIEDSIIEAGLARFYIREGTLVSKNTSYIGRTMYTYLSNLATLAFDVEEDIRLPTFSRVAGTGFFKKEGAGYLDMSQTDSSDFTGTVNIIDGTMNIGSLGADSKINVGSGATMEGGGKVGSVEVSVGGTLYQGASSVALHISGDYIQRGGTYRVQVGPQFKPVTVSGKTSITGTLDVAVHTDADMADTYIVLRSATTVVGQFAVKEDETVFSNIILLPGTRNVGVHYALKSKPVYHEYVQGRNGAGVAWALSQIDRRNQDNKPANYALLHITSEDQARRALSSLSGEMHVSAQAALMSSGTMLEDAAVGQMRMAFGKRAYASQRALRATMPVVALGLADRSNAGGGMGIWTKSLEFEKRYGGSAGVRSLIYSSSGSLLGFDLPAGDWRAGLFSGTSQAQFAEASGQSSGTSDSYHAGIYGGRMWSEVGLRAGMSYSSHAVRMGRKLSLPGTDNKLNSSYGAHTFAFYSQLDRRIGLGGVVFEPFVGLSHVRQTTEEFVEKGAAGLAIRSEQQQTSTSIVSAGMGISAGFRLGSARMRARGMLAWKHELGSRDMVARQSLGISDSFDVYGARKASDSLEVDAGLDMRLSKDANMSFVYSETDLLETGGRDGYFKAILNFAM